MTNQLAIITGGNRGLGRTMALHLADRGIDILFTYRGNAAEAREVAGAIEAKGRKVSALQLDVSDAAQLSAFAARVRTELAAKFQRASFDFLVNNAGHGHHAAFGEVTEDALDELYRVHLKAPILLTQQLLPLLADGGRILNVSTGLARFVFPGYAAYAAMKGAVEVLTRYQAKELGARGITVNTIAPGAIATDFGGGVVRDNPAVNAQIAGATALGRVGQPDDIGGAVALLLSPEARWITGQRIEVSGGMML